MTSEAKKFFLIDASNMDQLLKLQESKERLTPIVNRELKELDRLMLAIVNNSKLTDEEKVMAYNKSLAEFQTVAKEPKKIIKKIENTSTQPNIKTETQKHTYNPMIGIAQRYKSKAENVLSLLKARNAIGINEIGEILINDETIPNSNISDLLNKAVNPNSKTTLVPGWEKFKSLLALANVPQSLLVNKNTKAINQLKPPKKLQNKSPLRATKSTRSLRKWTPYDIEYGQKKKSA